MKDLIGTATNESSAKNNGTPSWRLGTPPRGCLHPSGGVGGGGGGGLQLRETPGGDVTVVDLSQHEVSVSICCDSSIVDCWFAALGLNSFSCRWEASNVDESSMRS